MENKMFTDTHCHISKEEYDDIDNIIKRATDNGIYKLINNGCNRQTNEEVLQLAQIYSNLYCAIGIHPDSAGEYTKEDLIFIEKQIELFEAQLKLAEKYSKPVIIHSRDATLDTITILKKYPNVKGSMHCFSGSLETANIYLKLGYKLGFGGVTTFKNSKIKDVLKQIPNSAILLETDSPYLAPEPRRGTRNDSRNVKYIAEKIAQVKGIDIEEMAKITYENTERIFQIK